MARDTAGERELREEPFHSLFIGKNIRINLTISSLEIGVRDQARPPMPGSGDVDHVEVVLFDQPVQVDIDKVQTWRRSPMAEEPRLELLLCPRLLEERVVIDIDLGDG